VSREASGADVAGAGTAGDTEESGKPSDVECDMSGVKG